MGRVTQRRDCKKDTEREVKPSPPSDRASASVGSVPSLECRALRPSSVSLQLVNKFVLDSRDSRSYLYYLESKSHVKRENFIFAATSIIGGQSQSSVRIFFDFFRLSSFYNSLVTSNWNWKYIQVKDGGSSKQTSLSYSYSKRRL